MAARPGEIIPDYLLSEVKLYDSASEREKYDNQADVFAIIQSLECLEGVYIKDAVLPKEYEQACTHLIAQFKAAQNKASLHSDAELEDFARKYRMNCRAALRRIKAGVPATVEYGGQKDENLAKLASRVTSGAITITDGLAMGLKGVHNLTLSMRDLVANLNKISTLPPDFVARAKCVKWLETLNSMAAHEEITEEQAKQLQLDIESMREDFDRFLDS